MKKNGADECNVAFALTLVNSSLPVVFYFLQFFCY